MDKPCLQLIRQSLAFLIKNIFCLLVLWEIYMRYLKHTHSSPTLPVSKHPFLSPISSHSFKISSFSLSPTLSWEWVMGMCVWLSRHYGRWTLCLLRWWWDFMHTFPLLCWDFVWLQLALDAVTVTVFIGASAPLCLAHTVSLRSATILAFTIFSTPLLRRS